MKEAQTTGNHARTTPQYVWSTLTAVQQQEVGRIVMRVCQELAIQWNYKKKGEHNATR